MVKCLDRVYVSGKDGVVSDVKADGTIEVVYVDDLGRDIYEDAHMLEGKWRFIHAGPAGGYAQSKDRLKEAVQKLHMSPETRSRLGE